MSRSMQTSKRTELLDHKEMACQTEQGGALTSYGNVSDGGEHNLDGDTQHSTNLNITSDMGGRNRI